MEKTVEVSLNQPRVLLIGLGESESKPLRGFFESADFKEIKTGEEFEAQMFDFSDANQDLIFCGDTLPGISPVELAQTLRTTCSETYIFFVSSDLRLAALKDLAKNGYDQAFFLPFDLHFLKEKVQEISADLSATTARVYKSIPFDDFEPGRINFDLWVFLSANNRYIKLVGRGEEVTPTHMERLRKHVVTDVYLENKDIKLFYEYSARQLSKKSKAAKGSRLEAKEKIKAAVRSTFLGLLNSDDGSFDAGRAMVEQSQAMLKEFISESACKSLNDGLQLCIGEREDTYTHAWRVASFGMLFSMGLGLGSPENIGIAALFHDLGLTLAHEQTEESLASNSPEVQEAYRQHPFTALKILLSKRLILVPEVQAAIEQHHERPDGKGFPKQISDQKISTEAQILTLADRFEELTGFIPGRRRLSPQDALSQISAEGSVRNSLINSALSLVTKS